jgi:hypothetical protein
VYFGGTGTGSIPNALRQWYAPLADLSATWPVAIITRSPVAARQLGEEAPVPTVWLPRAADLAGFVSLQPIRIIFYVDQDARNFEMFRYGRMWHVYLDPGETEGLPAELGTISSQLSAYSYLFVPGDAARQRLERGLWHFDTAEAISMGFPPADHFAAPLPFAPDDRTVVLYAPTWEGESPASAYGSLASHGVTLVSALLASGAHRLIYRPHPRSGSSDADYARAHHTIVQAIARANAADPAAHHIVDDGSAVGWQLLCSDVAITDISSVVYQRLATGKPLVVPLPVAPEAQIDEAGYFGDAEWLTHDQAKDIVSVVDLLQHSDPARLKLHYWVDRYFGDTSPGRATQRFRAAVQLLIDEWDAQSALHPDDAETTATDGR